MEEAKLKVSRKSKQISPPPELDTRAQTTIKIIELVLNGIPGAWEHISLDVTNLLCDKVSAELEIMNRVKLQQKQNIKPVVLHTSFVHTIEKMYLNFWRLHEGLYKIIAVGREMLKKIMNFILLFMELEKMLLQFFVK